MPALSYFCKTCFLKGNLIRISAEMPSTLLSSDVLVIENKLKLSENVCSIRISALKSWLQLILAKYDINGNYSEYIKATSTKLATIIVRPSVNKLQYFVAIETVT